MAKVFYPKLCTCFVKVRFLQCEQNLSLVIFMLLAKI